MYLGVYATDHDRGHPFHLCYPSHPPRSPCHPLHTLIYGLRRKGPRGGGRCALAQSGLHCCLRKEEDPDPSESNVLDLFSC